MWISKLTIKDLGSFSDATIQFGKKINILTGPNNSGKSTLIKAALLLQTQNILGAENVRINSEKSNITIMLDGSIQDFNQYFSSDVTAVIFSETLTRGTRSRNFKAPNGNGVSKQNIVGNEPYNYIYPFLSKRKVNEYNQNVDTASTNAVTGNLQNLGAKVLRITSGDKVLYKKFSAACESILGYEIATVDTGGGRKAGYFVNSFQKILIENMGEGVANIVGLIENLLMARGNLFLIEEIENDIHPKALKALLKLIIESSNKNQFLISTHSNIVLKTLGADESTKIFNTFVTIDENNIFTSTVKELPNTAEDRINALMELGYEFSDFDLWSAWLFLEESSAEKIVRDYLIPWFSPTLLGKLRTFSAGGFSKIEPKFEDFNGLFVYLHLESNYKNKVWVLIDGGEQEEAVILKLKETYKKSGWNESRFNQLSQHDFEKYYPEIFSKDVDRILTIQSKDERRKEKAILLKKVLVWIKEDESRAKIEFEKSANEVIKHLKIIEASLNN